jgi:hypothetical protein
MLPARLQENRARPRGERWGRSQSQARISARRAQPVRKDCGAVLSKDQLSDMQPAVQVSPGAYLSRRRSRKSSAPVCPALIKIGDDSGTSAKGAFFRRTAVRLRARRPQTACLHYLRLVASDEPPPSRQSESSLSRPTGEGF